MSAPDPALERLIASLGASINVRALYPPQHPRVVGAIARAAEDLAAACRERRQDAVTFLLVGDDLVVDDQALRRSSVYQQHFVVALRRMGVEALTLAIGVDAPEYQAFIGAMAAGTTPVSSAHIVVGRVRVAVAEGGEGGAEGPGGAGQPLSAGQLDTARESFVAFRAGGRTGLGRMDEVVWSLTESLARSTRAVLPVARLKDHDEYTFVHSVNVSLLVLAQARSFGFQGPILHAVGLAALVHDIGKLRIPIAVLNKAGRLEDSEWQVMMGHAELGARHLAAIEGVGPLSIVVAYEHHLRYDGNPSYPALKTSRRPTLASQMTALADTYDAISTARPYQKAMSRSVALGILRDRAGTFLDPLLVGNFLRVLGAGVPGPAG